MTTGVDPSEDKVNAFKNNLKLLDQLIGDNKFLTGSDLTIADFSVLATTQVLFFIEYDLTDYPNFKRWSTTHQSELPFYGEVNDMNREEVNAYFEKVKARMASLKQNK